ncbi:MAG: hypothetical protein IT524_04230 [Nitrosomonas sp.]|nr:hypothetical protein [Nitrosomonas sp.]
MNRLIVISLILMLNSFNVMADYFNTARTEKIFGIFLTESAQLDEVDAHSNSFGFWPRTLEEITEYLDVNNNKLLPVMKINHFLLDADTGIYHDDVSGIIAAIERSTLHQRNILFFMDEPMWNVRGECVIRNKTPACHEVANRYVQTLDTLRRAGQALRQRFPGSGIMHIEAWTELTLQKREFPDEKVVVLDDAEYLGFDCYGAIHRCGSQEYGYRHQVEYGEWVWSAMMTLEANNSIGRKLLLVPGTFLAEEYFDDIETLLEQIAFYAWVLQQSDKIGGFGAFLWGDMIERSKYFTGARHIPAVTSFLAFISRLYGVQDLTEQQWNCIASTRSCTQATVQSSGLTMSSSESQSPQVPPFLPGYATPQRRLRAP